MTIPLRISRIFLITAHRACILVLPHEPTAFCHNCQEMTPMVWLPQEERGKNCDTWFKCEFCGGRHLTIKYITEKEAVAKNKLAKEAEDL